MPISRAGIKGIFLCKKGTLGTPSNQFATGISGSHQLIISQVDDMKDVLGRDIRNRTTFKAEATTHQTTMADLYNNFLAVYGPDQGVDAQVVVMEKWGDGQYKTFAFGGNEFMGLDWEYEANPKMKSLKLTLEQNVYNDRALAVISGATTLNTPVSWLTSNSWGLNTNKLGNTGFVSLRDANNNLLVALDELVNWNIKLKTTGTKSEVSGRSFTDYIEATLEVTIRNASLTMGASKLDTLYRLGMFDTVKLKIQPNSSVSGTTEEFVFQNSSLSNKSEFKFGGDEVYSKLIFGGKIPLSDFALTGSTDRVLTIG